MKWFLIYSLAAMSLSALRSFYWLQLGKFPVIRERTSGEVTMDLIEYLAVTVWAIFLLNS